MMSAFNKIFPASDQQKNGALNDNRRQDADFVFMIRISKDLKLPVWSNAFSGLFLLPEKIYIDRSGQRHEIKYQRGDVCQHCSRTISRKLLKKIDDIGRRQIVLSLISQ